MVMMVEMGDDGKGNEGGGGHWQRMRDGVKDDKESVE